MKFLILRNCWSDFMLLYVSSCFLLFVPLVYFMFFLIYKLFIYLSFCFKKCVGQIYGIRMKCL